MPMPNVVMAYSADQKTTTAYGKRKLISKINTFLYSLVVGNNHATTDFWVQVYDVTGADEDAAGTAADLVEPDFEVICPAQSFVPFAFPAGWRMGKGCYVRCVTAAANAVLGK